MLSVVMGMPERLTNINWVDYLFLVVLVYSVLSGAWIGFFAECLSVAGVAAGTILAGITYNGAGSLLAHVGVPPDARDWAGFVAVFVLISLVFRLVSIKARKVAENAGCGQGQPARRCAHRSDRRCHDLPVRLRHRCLLRRREGDQSAAQFTDRAELQGSGSASSLRCFPTRCTRCLGRVTRRRNRVLRHVLHHSRLIRAAQLTVLGPDIVVGGSSSGQST